MIGPRSSAGPSGVARPGSPLPGRSDGQLARWPSLPWIPLLLLLLSLLDLRVELLLLLDHFTFTSLAQAISSHPLPVLILLLQGSLWRRYCSRR